MILGTWKPPKNPGRINPKDAGVSEKTGVVFSTLTAELSA